MHLATFTTRPCHKVTHIFNCFRRKLWVSERGNFLPLEGGGNPNLPWIFHVVSEQNPYNVLFWKNPPFPLDPTPTSLPRRKHFLKFLNQCEPEASYGATPRLISGHVQRTVLVLWLTGKVLIHLSWEHYIGYIGLYTPRKINIELENDGLEDNFHFPGGYSQVPC